MKDLAERENQTDGSLSLVRGTFHKDVGERKKRIDVHERTMKPVLGSIWEILRLDTQPGSVSLPQSMWSEALLSFPVR